MTEKQDKPSPNDQRSDVKNPNNPAHKQNQDNRANQLNPNQKQQKGGHPQSSPKHGPSNS